MKILFLSQRFLLPMDTGGKIRTGNILKHLSRKHHITLISNVESPKDDPFIQQIDALCTHFIAVPWNEVKRRSLIFWSRLALQMFSVFPVSVLNDYSKHLTRTVEDTLRNGQFDLAVCDFVQSALMFKEVVDTPTLLFQHNVESTIMRRHISKTNSPISRLFWWMQWKKMIWFEELACRRFDRVVAVSRQDKAAFARIYGLNNVDTIPTGVDIDYYRPISFITETPNSLVFCGSMDWLPNEDAMVFFTRDIFPNIIKRVPDTTLTIVGRHPSPSLRKTVGKFPGITLTGWVEDTRPFIAKASFVIVPLRIGGGTRMKIYEAMAMGKPVISTSIGAEGLPVIDKKVIFLEDNPTEFAETIITLFDDRDRRNRIASNGMAFVRKHFAWPNVTAVFESICLNTAFKNRVKNKNHG